MGILSASVPGMRHGPERPLPPTRPPSAPTNRLSLEPGVSLSPDHSRQGLIGFEVGGGSLVQYEDFGYISFAGSGTYGEVWKARHVRTGHLYAIKSLSKDGVASRRNLAQVLREKSILSQDQMAGHPFIVTLHHTFQSQNKLHFVMDWASGGDLYTAVQKFPQGRVSENKARLISAEVIIALRHVHSLGITYRDLKQENILISSDGHIMLSGSSFRSQVTCSRAYMHATVVYFAEGCVWATQGARMRSNGQRRLTIAIMPQ